VFAVLQVMENNLAERSECLAKPGSHLGELVEKGALFNSSISHIDKIS
jgi:hypothetical protein